MTTATESTRTARINGGARTRKEVDAYLPSNYATVVVEAYPGTEPPKGAAARVVVEDYDGKLVIIRIVGTDVAGWTLDGYVIPRLASGLIWAEEVPSEVAEVEAAVLASQEVD